MGYFDNVPQNNNPKTSGYFDNIPTSPKKPTFGERASAVGSGFLDMFRNPSEAQKNYEAQVLPQYYQGDSKILKALTAPGTAIARGTLKGFSRLITPGLTPLTDDVAEIYEVSKKNGIADKVASGQLPVDTLKDFQVLQKTSPQIVGDVAQAVLTLYTGGKTKSVAGSAKDIGFKQAFKKGAVENIVPGLLFGEATNLSDEVKGFDQLKNIGLSTAMISLLGGIVSGTVPASKALIREVENLRNIKYIPTEFPKKLDVKSIGGVRDVPLNTPGTRFAEYNQKMGYEPYTPQSELPTIEMGAKAKSDLPTIQLEPKQRQVPGDIRYEKIPDVVRSIVNEGKASPELIAQAKSFSEVPRFEPKQVVPEGKTIIPQLASDVEKAAIEAKLVTRFEGLPESKVMNMKQQASEAADLVANDYAKAKRVALGDEVPPGELRDASVFEAVLNKATKDGDSVTLRQLATESTIPSKLTAYGQEIKAADRLVDTTDPVELMQTIIKSREKGINSRNKIVKSESVKNLKESIKKNAPSKNDWGDFINSIEC